MTYQQKKEIVRAETIDWQLDFENHNYYWAEISEWQDYFEKLARRYGLVQEFRENAII